MARPTGVTILAVLYALGAVVLVLAALVMFVAGSVFLDPALQDDMGAMSGGDPELAQAQSEAMTLFATLFPVLGVLALAFAVVDGALAVGMWRGRPWAWTLGIAFAGLGLVFAVGGLLTMDLTSLFGLAINGFLLWYFTQEGVKRWFGKAVAAAPSPPAGFAPPPAQ